MALRIVLLMLLAWGSLRPAAASQPTYSQAEIDRLLAEISHDYGLHFAYPGEWQAANAGELMALVQALHLFKAHLQQAAAGLHAHAPLAAASPAGSFRRAFWRAGLHIDRAGTLPGGFDGNTVPHYADGAVLYYSLQFTLQGMSSPYVVLHELGHVLDNLLQDQPQAHFHAWLGGSMGAAGWQPGLDYAGNEGLFLRARAGLNEDFADTFAQYLRGQLSPGITPARYQFMRRWLPWWLLHLGPIPFFCGISLG